MTLCDTSPLVALIDRNDSGHDRCAAALSSLPAGGLLTTWPCLTEALHLLNRVRGLQTQNELWSFIADGLLRLHLPEESDWRRLHELMNQYADMPLDMADASLILAAEKRGLTTLFSLDQRLRAVKLASGAALHLVP